MFTVGSIRDLSVLKKLCRALAAPRPGAALVAMSARRTRRWPARLAGLLIFAVSSVTAGAEGSQIQRAEALAGAFERLAAAIPEHRYNIDALAEHLDYDVEAAARHVSSAIAFEPYLGVMRGPEGTISAGAGSVWDQAVLAAALINAMGGEALLVRGPLGAPDRDRLLRGSFQPRAMATLPLPPDVITREFRGLLPDDVTERLREQLSGIDVSGSREDNPAITAVAAQLIRNAGAAGFDLSPTALPEAFLQSLSEQYVWVRYRDRPADPWRDLHPAFGATAEPPQIEPRVFLSGSVPEEMLHRAEIQMFLLQDTGETVREVPIMEPYVRPVANLLPEQISLAIVPVGGAGGETAAPDYYLPMLNGGTAPGGTLFNDLGMIADAELVGGPPGVFGELSQALAGSARALDANLPELAGVLLTVTLHLPGGERLVQRRRLAVPGSGASTEGRESLLFDGQFLFRAGPENGAMALHRLFTALAALLRDAGSLTPRWPDTRTADAASPGDTRMRLERRWLEAILSSEILAPPPRRDRIVVRRAPLVAMRRIGSGMDGPSSTRVTLDILHQPVLALRFEDAGGEVTLMPDAAVAQGVRETLYEGLLIREKSPDAADLGTRGDAQTVSDETQLDTLLATAKPDSQLGQRLADDLAYSGLLVVERLDENPFWWRIDPRTGTTLGMSRGGGAELADYSLFNSAMTVYSVIMWAKSMADCNETYPDNDTMWMCCQAGATMWALAGTVSGGAFSEKAAKGVSTALGSSWKAGLGYIAASIGYEGYQSVIGMGTGALGDAACKAAFQ